MRDPYQVDPDGPISVARFYHSHALPYLIARDQNEIRRRLHDVPASLREHHLAPRFTALGETTGDTPWRVLYDYLGVLEHAIAEIAGGHSPSFWFHLHRRIRPMLSPSHDGKTDDTTVTLVRRIAELAYAKHGDLDRTDDLGPIHQARLNTFLDGVWYLAVADAMGSKLKAKAEFQRLKRTEQVVMTDFRSADLHDVFGIEGLCYEYWWASAAMRSIGKGSVAKWNVESDVIVFRDDVVHPICFEIYDRRNEERAGFYTRLGTWMDAAQLDGDNEAFARSETVYFAQLTPNPKLGEYPAWNDETQTVIKGVGMTNFGLGTFSLAEFRRQNSFMVESFRQKRGVELDGILFAVWMASFFAVFTELSFFKLSAGEKRARTVKNLSNLQFRGYAMNRLNLAELAGEAVWWAERIGFEHNLSAEQVQQGFAYIALSAEGQANIGLWSGGKRPILIPALDGYMIDLAATLPFLQTIFFGLRKVPQLGGTAFEDSVRTGLRKRGLDVCLHGELRWSEETPREVDAAVRIGDKLVVIECFSYELPLDYDLGKPSIFEARKQFITEKLNQARSLAERLTKSPTGTNFDVAWAKEVDWRVVSPFVEFAWGINEPFFDQDGLPRLFQAQELMDNLAAGRVPAADCVPLVKAIRNMTLKGIWY